MLILFIFIFGIGKFEVISSDLKRKKIVGKISKSHFAKTFCSVNRNAAYV